MFYTVNRRYLELLKETSGTHKAHVPICSVHFSIFSKSPTSDVLGQGNPNMCRDTPGPGLEILSKMTIDRTPLTFKKKCFFHSWTSILHTEFYLSALSSRHAVC